MSASPSPVPISSGGRSLRQLPYRFIPVPWNFPEAVTRLHLNSVDQAYLLSITRETWGHPDRPEFSSKCTEQERASEFRTSVSYFRESCEKLIKLGLIQADRSGPHRHKRGYRLKLATFENLPKLPESKRKKRHQTRTPAPAIAARLECPLQQVRAAGLSCPVDKLYQVGGGLLSNLEPSPGPASGDMGSASGPDRKFPSGQASSASGTASPATASGSGIAGGGGVGRRKPAGSEQQAKKTTATAVVSTQVLSSHGLPDASPELPGADPLAGNGGGVLEPAAGKVGSEEKAKKTTATAVDSKQVLSPQQFIDALKTLILRIFLAAKLFKGWSADQKYLVQLAEGLGYAHLAEFEQVLQDRVERKKIRDPGLLKNLVKDALELAADLEKARGQPDTDFAKALNRKQEQDEQDRQRLRQIDQEKLRKHRAMMEPLYNKRE